MSEASSPGGTICAPALVRVIGDDRTRRLARPRRGGGRSEDHRGRGEVPWFVPVSAPAEARDLMSTPVTAMVPATSLIFSISMGVLTLAATQFGPRLVRNFMSMRQTQLTLGTFVMTIVYGLITLTLMAQTPAARPGPSPPSRLRWRAWGFSARSSTGSPGRSWRRQSSRGWVPS
ncbi:DUF2254 family protein [Cereibacter sphaeroides]|uniref:DUF2254 family protein n=1 Tax=Cereibacter sphaeroides TaxID=1063 RepID=UPI0039906589